MEERLACERNLLHLLEFIYIYALWHVISSSFWQAVSLAGNGERKMRSSPRLDICSLILFWVRRVVNPLLAGDRIHPQRFLHLHSTRGSLAADRRPACFQLGRERPNPSGRLIRTPGLAGRLDLELAAFQA
jgi:hypothetical protein